MSEVKTVGPKFCLHGQWSLLYTRTTNDLESVDWLGVAYIEPSVREDFRHQDVQFIRAEAGM
jgi:hypothetical protein